MKYIFLSGGICMPGIDQLLFLLYVIFRSMPCSASPDAIQGFPSTVPLYQYIQAGVGRPSQYTSTNFRVNSGGVSFTPSYSSSRAAATPKSTPSFSRYNSPEIK